MITFSREAARRYWSVLRPLLAGIPRRQWPSIYLSAAPDGVRFSAQHDLVGLEYLVPGGQAPCHVTVPWELFSKMTDRRADHITVSADEAGWVVARWQDGDVPRQTRFAVASQPAPSRLVSPTSWTETPAQLPAALHDVMQVTDSTSLRYALGCVQLNGQDGTLSGTDGRQILRHAGWQFGFTDEILVPATKVFGCKEFAAANSVRLGRTEQHLVVHIDTWKIFLALNRTGRFPRIVDILAAVEQAPTRLVLDSGDREFLIDNLPRLPGGPENHRGVTVELNGRVAIRARESTASTPTELVLSRSSRLGPEVRFCTDRRLLARALELGFNELAISGPQQPVACRDERRTYLWALLEPDAALAPSDDAIVIESQPGAASEPLKMAVVAQVAGAVVPPPTASPSPPQAVAEPSDRPAVEFSSLDQALALRNLARELLAQSNDLVRTVKRHQREVRQRQRDLRRRRQLQPAA